MLCEIVLCQITVCLCLVLDFKPYLLEAQLVERRPSWVRIPPRTDLEKRVVVGVVVLFAFLPKLA